MVLAKSSKRESDDVVVGDITFDDFLMCNNSKCVAVNITAVFTSMPALRSEADIVSAL